MISDADMLEEIDARLAAVADVQFALIQKIQGRIQAADDAAELQALAEPLDRCARSIRLTYALRVKLRKDIRSLDREETRRAESAAREEAERPWNRIRNTVQTLTWREIDWEEEDEDEFAEKLDRILDYEALDPAFIHLPLEQQVARVIRALGFKAVLYPPPQGEGDREAVEGAQTHSPFQSSA
ncbi:hypothetical protein ACO2Q0_06335 [Phenylobacterium sp. VNQ135]|uniref:hypothetical protein n=1 Tax=Phenylobacterium sp. VNQ135 TaxID=3400922 RepID=UPI003C076396